MPKGDLVCGHPNTSRLNTTVPINVKSVFFVFGICCLGSVPGLAQCVEAAPAAYPLNGQVSLHVLDPDCSFDPKWRKYLADPSVEGVALVYHSQSVGRQSMQLALTNPSSGLALAVWDLDGKVSAKAIVTTASDVGGDFSAFVATVEGASCNSTRVGSAVTLPDGTSVAGLVRKVIEGPRCILHVIKSSAIRPLLSVRVPDGAALMDLNCPQSALGLCRAVAPQPSSTDTGKPEAERIESVRQDSPIPMMFIVKNQRVTVWTPEMVNRLAQAVLEAWGGGKPPIKIEFPFRESEEAEWLRMLPPSEATNHILIFLETSFWRFHYTVAVQRKGRLEPCVGPKTAFNKSMTWNGVLAPAAKNIVQMAHHSSCLVRTGQ